MPSEPITLWRITDGRAGHDAQSEGLAAALARRTRCVRFDIPALSGLALWTGLLRRRFEPGRELPDPDLILGAGHGTHLSMLCAQAARGGRTIVLMKPTLPTGWFDLCLIPEHDRPRPAANVVPTRGALNRIVPSSAQDPLLGLILIGGPSRHYHWDEPALLQQLETILGRNPAMHWQMTDSPRTPESTRHALASLRHHTLQYVSYRQTRPGWVAEQLARAATAWVSEDSVSMIYEVLTAGAAVGLLAVPPAGRGRVVEGIDRLARDRMVTRYHNWETGTALNTGAAPLDEAGRCADILLTRYAPAARGSA